MIKNVFLDSSVIIDWLIFSKNKDKHTRNYTKLKSSYDIVESALGSKSQYNYFTSTLVFYEVARVIRDDATIGKMYINGESLRSILRVNDRNNYGLSKEDISEISTDYFSKITLLSNKVTLADITSSPSFLLGVNSIFKNGLEAMDAYLVYQAQSTECEFFITRDSRIKENTKGLEIKMCNPDTFISYL